jgi:hypothetical protein
MLRPVEIREGNGQVQFSRMVLETAQIQSQQKLGRANPSPLLTGKRIDLSGTHVLVGSLSAFCTVGLLLWAFVRLWLFE